MVKGEKPRENSKQNIEESENVEWNIGSQQRREIVKISEDQ